MIELTSLYVLATVGGVAAIMWMLELRIYVTGAVSGGSWALIAYTAANIEKHTLDGSAIIIDGWHVQALATFLAAVSFLALVATYFGHYPPEPEALE